MKPASLTDYLAACQLYQLKPGYVFATDRAQVIQTVLGSCVSVCIHDKRRKAGGMNHYLLPEPTSAARTARFGVPAIQALVRCMVDMGSAMEDLVAQVIGGASMKGHAESLKIGSANIQVAKDCLNRYGMRILSEDVGGHLGRKVLFLTEKNQVLVYKLENVRRADFYDYQDDERELYGRNH